MEILNQYSVFVSLGLFLVALIIMGALRSADKKNSRLPTVKKMVEKFESEVERSFQSFRQEVAETESKIAAKTSEVKDLLRTVTSQIQEVTSYSDDMARIRTAMKSYHDAMNGLAKLSQDAEDKVNEVTSDTERLEEVRLVIEQFRKDMQEADEHLTNHEKRVVELETASLDKVSAAVSNCATKTESALSQMEKKYQDVVYASAVEVEKAADDKLKYLEDALENLRYSADKNLKSLEERFDVFKQASEMLTTNGKEVLSNICERSSQLLLASETVESLAEQRDRLEKQIAELADLKKIEEDNISIARAEYNRLDSAIKTNEEKVSIEIQDMDIPDFDSPVPPTGLI